MFLQLYLPRFLFKNKQITKKNIEKGHIMLFVSEIIFFMLLTYFNAIKKMGQHDKCQQTEKDNNEIKNKLLETLQTEC